MDKTQFLCNVEEITDLNLNLENNEFIKKCESCNYLGIHFNKEGTDVTDLLKKQNEE